MFLVSFKVGTLKVLELSMAPPFVGLVVRFIDPTSTRANHARFLQVRGVTWNADAAQYVCACVDVSPTV